MTTLSWTEVAIPGMAGKWINGATTFGALTIIVGDDSSIYTSADLATWTKRTVPITDSYLWDVAASPTAVVAIGGANSNDAPRVLRSTDGITWTSVSVPITAWLNRVAYVNGKWQIGAGDFRRIAYSNNDGVTWLSASGATSAGVRVMAFAHGAGRYVAACSTGVVHGTNGEAWTTGLDTTDGRNFKDVAFGNGVFVIVGELPGAPSQSRLLRSTDGITWTAVNIAGVAGLERVIYFGGYFYAVGTDRWVCRSADGITWDTQQVGSAANWPWRAIAPLGTALVLGGQVNQIGFSEDGATWTSSADVYGNGSTYGLTPVGPRMLAWGESAGAVGVGVLEEFASIAWPVDVAAPSFASIAWPISVVALPYASIAWPLVVQPVAYVTAAWPVAVAAPPALSAVLDWPVAVAVPGTRSLAWPLSVVPDSIISGLNGAASWAAAPDGRWQAVVVLDGADISARIIGAVTVRIEDNAARTAQFDFVPAAAVQPMALIGRRVKIAFSQPGGLNAQTIFTGVVDVPEIDLQTGVIACACTDQAQEVWANTPRETIDEMVGGRWHVAVSGEPEDSFQYLEERIQSVGASWALDALQSPRVLPWASPARSVTVRTADVIDGSLSVTLPSRDQLRTRINVRMQYRFTRLRQRGAVAQYGQDLGFFLPTTGVFPRPSRQWLTSAMVDGATSGAGGWALQSLTVEHPPAGFWNLGDAVYVIPANVAPDLALGFSARYTTRWQQSITEDYTVAVVWDALEAQLGGPVQEEIGAALEAEFDQPGWGADESITPAVPYAVAGDAFVDWQPDGFDAAARDEALRCLLDRAWVRLWAASRSGRVRFALPCRPDLWLDTAVTMEHEALRAAGRIVEITHTLDTAAGAASSDIGVAVGMPGATPASHPVWVLPAAPAETYTPPLSAYSFEIGTFVGGEIASPAFDADTMIGFSTNQEGAVYYDREYYPHQLSIRSPDMAAEDRDARTLTSTTTISVTVPTDTLEVI